MDFEMLDILYRSRQTLLQILKAKGYNTKPYEKFGPFEIEKMSSNDKENTLNMELKREVAADSGIPSTCLVVYAIPRVKNRLTNFLPKLLTDPDTGDDIIDSATTEIIIITLEAIGDTFNAAAVNQWSKRNLRIAFFDAHTLVSNPLEHVLVPFHEIVPETEHEALLKKYNMKTKFNLPVIRFHEDIIGRILGLIPGSIVKITRPSPSAGEYVLYRVCVP
jgi:DNA-directed RNA polymerase subunit H (RpoH/RPB5)